MDEPSKTLYVGLDVHKDSITVAYAPALAVEEDVAPDPRDVGRLRTSAVVAEPSGGPGAVEQARLGRLRWTCLMNRERVAAPAGAGDRRVDRRAVHRSAIPFAPHGR
jgi:hypothetical protein